MTQENRETEDRIKEREKKQKRVENMRLNLQVERHHKPSHKTVRPADCNKRAGDPGVFRARTIRQIAQE